MASFPTSDRDARDFVDGMMTNRPSREREEEQRDHERRQDQEAIQEMEGFWKGLLQEISEIITDKQDTFDNMKVFRFKHLEYYIREQTELNFLLEKDFTEENFEILKEWCDGKMEKIIFILNERDDDSGNLEFILGKEYLSTRSTRRSVDYTERKNKFSAMRKIINTPPTPRSKKNYMKIADICRLLNFFREIDWDDEIKNKTNFFNNMKEMNGYGPEDKALGGIDLPNWFGRGKDFLGSSEGEKKESEPKKESSKKAVSRGKCPLCNKSVLTTELRRNVKDRYYHEKCYKSSTTTAPELSQFEKDMAERAALRKSRKSSAKSSTKPSEKSSAKSSAKSSTTPMFKIDTKTLKALAKKRREGGRKRTKRRRKKTRRRTKKTRKKRRKKHRDTRRKK